MSSTRGLALGALTLTLVAAVRPAAAASSVPTDVEVPGTQPGERTPLSSPDSCSFCHGDTTNPELEPTFGWSGSAMGQSARDPIFWAAMAIAEQDFLPDADPAVRGGGGNLCLKCHAPNGWLSGRAVPTDGSGLSLRDAQGVECELCHQLVDPDLPVNVPGTTELQTAPYVSYDAGGNPWYGNAQLVLDAERARLGPYDDAQTTSHEWAQSSFFRSSELCGSCHDVSNPAVGDLAHNNGAPVPLTPASFSGVPGSPVAGKAAFNNPPYAYGVAERTYSEWFSSGYRGLDVNDFSTLPVPLRTTGGSVEIAYSKATAADGNADHVDGTPREYSCQSCHMGPGTGLGCNQFGVTPRDDLGSHDLSGAAYWLADAILYQADAGTLRFGSPLLNSQRTAIRAGQQRAMATLRSAALLEATPNGGDLDIRVTNLTGHKLTSGYPEGRRMWLNVKFYDAAGGLLDEHGAYGPIGNVVQDRAGIPHDVPALRDPAATVTFETEAALDQEWASQLLGFGYDPGLVLSYDRVTNAPEHTLGELAADPPGTAYHSFHFLLNNVVQSDDRIPPYGMRYDEAAVRHTLPVPATLYGDPGAGGIYDHFAAVPLTMPVGTERADVRLMYQQVTWEYVQFLWLQNDGLSPFLGEEGVNLLDTWLNAGKSEPFEMARSVVWLNGAVPPGEAARHDQQPEQMRVVKNRTTGGIDVHYGAACNALDHTIYAGDLPAIASYAYGEAFCALGDSGVATIDPTPDDAFFVIVGNNGAVEGSYGPDEAGGERPAASGLPGCDYPQDLTGTCDQ